MIYDEVFLNEYGFYQLKNPPSDKERERYYKEQYYQQAKGSYELSYSNEELKYFRAKLEQKLTVINEHYLNYLGVGGAKCSFLDIGCGEGFAVAFFKENGFDVLGLDYSIEGVMRQNPDIAENVVLGDIYDNIQLLFDEDKLFDIINMDNLLEHVVEPKTLLCQVHDLLKDNGIVIIGVPNDFSYLQSYFAKREIITRPHWVAPLDHISYFNKNGLINLCVDAGFNCIDFLSSGVVELFALNPNTNYFENKSVGKSCHLASVEIENILHSISPVKTIELYRILGSMGLGRKIIGIFKKKL